MPASVGYNPTTTKYVSERSTYHNLMFTPSTRFRELNTEQLYDYELDYIFHVIMEFMEKQRLNHIE